MDSNSVDISIQKFIAIILCNSMKNNITFAKQNSLSMSQIRTMFRLHHGGSSGVTEISEALGISSAAVSQMLEHMVQQGIIQRTESADDRRMKVIVLTEKGKQIAKEYVNLHHKWVSDLTENLSPEEKEKTIEVMNLLIEKAKKMGDIHAESRNFKVCCD